MHFLYQLPFYMVLMNVSGLPHELFQNGSTLKSLRWASLVDERESRLKYYCKQPTHINARMMNQDFFD